MLKEIDLNERQFNLNNAGERTVAKTIDALITAGKSVIAKDKFTAKGHFINIYVYDKNVFRYLIFTSVQVG